MDNIILVKVVHGLQDLTYGLSSILFCEFALLADTVEQLSAGC
jgi:hypothetical protein